MPTISIIVPVYNTEKYLHRCIGSILAQTFTDFELLLIDDGSTDASGAICDEYAAKDNRIRVFHKNNGGVSSARNLGLDNAIGEWITFVDADDWIEKIGFSFLKKCNEEKIIINSYLKFYEGKFYKEDIASLLVFTKKEKDDFLKKYLPHGILTTVCSKIYRREIIGNIRFNKEFIVGEDTLFFINVISQVYQISTNDQPYYVYRMFPANNKYTMNINTAVANMQTLWYAYEKLQVRIPSFEKKIFCDYKSYCQAQIEVIPREWYDNKFVQGIYKRVKEQLSFEYRFKYILMKYKSLRKLLGICRKMNSRFLLISLFI